MPISGTRVWTIRQFPPSMAPASVAGITRNGRLLQPQSGVPPVRDLPDPLIPPCSDDYLHVTADVNAAQRWASDDDAMLPCRIDVETLTFHAWKK